MKSTWKVALAVAAMAGALFAPRISAAEPQSSYTTTFQATDQASKTAYFYGTLSLDVASSGIVRGWYRAQYEGTYVPVSGSYKDGKYWLSFDNGAFYVYGTRQADGSIAGSASQTLNPAARDLFSTQPTVAASSTDLSPQTFQFAAKPVAI